MRLSSCRLALNKETLVLNCHFENFVSLTSHLRVLPEKVRYQLTDIVRMKALVGLARKFEP